MTNIVLGIGCNKVSKKINWEIYMHFKLPKGNQNRFDKRRSTL